MTAGSQACSPAAQALMNQMRADQRSRTGPWTVADVRADLHAAFAPRCKRALKSLAPDLSYTDLGGVRCMVIEPREKASGDTILYFFGGGFISGSPELELPLTARLCALTGLRIVLPYYALAPEHPYPRALEQAMSVYTALTETCSGKIIVSGESAGGGLALSVLSGLEERRLPVPAALCLFSPWIDLTEDGHRAGESIDDPTLDADLLKMAAESYCAGGDAAEISPAHAHRFLSGPPTYISSGDNDIMRPSLERFSKVRSGADWPIELKIWDNMWHVFELYDEIPEAETAIIYAADFLNSALPRSI